MAAPAGAADDHGRQRRGVPARLYHRFRIILKIKLCIIIRAASFATNGRQWAGALLAIARRSAATVKVRTQEAIEEIF